MLHDFRSDTVTVPTAAMRAAIAEAPVGDDVFGDDPSVNRLQDRVADLLGKEAALFVPSGTMANQVAIRTHTEPGDEIIAEATSHIFLYEGGGFAALSGVSLRQVPGVRGILDPSAVAAAVRPPGGLSHYPVSKLLCVEDTANRGGGTVYPLETLHALRTVADAHGLRMHLDGARLLNAAVALGVPPADLAAPFDSISLCLSKGLGAPVGSLLVGSRPFVDRAHRFRKMFGGGMRQAGLLAAAGLHALEHHVDRLADDHTRAHRLAAALAALPGISVDLHSVQTNMAYVDFAGTGRDSAAWSAWLADRGVLASAPSPTTLRFVTHLQVGDDAVDAAIAAVRAGLEGSGPRPLET
jgi:threonine aldolase